MNFMSPQKVKLAPSCCFEKAPLTRMFFFFQLLFKTSSQDFCRVLTVSLSCSLKRMEGTYFVVPLPTSPSLHLPIVYDILVSLLLENLSLWDWGGRDPPLSLAKERFLVCEHHLLFSVL